MVDNEYIGKAAITRQSSKLVNDYVCMESIENIYETGNKLKHITMSILYNF